MLIKHNEAVQDATLHGLFDFVNEHGVCDIDVTTSLTQFSQWVVHRML